MPNLKKIFGAIHLQSHLSLTTFQTIGNSTPRLKLKTLISVSKMNMITLKNMLFMDGIVGTFSLIRVPGI